MWLLLAPFWLLELVAVSIGSDRLVRTFIKTVSENDAGVATQ